VEDDKVKQGPQPAFGKVDDLQPAMQGGQGGGNGQRPEIACLAAQEGGERTGGRTSVAQGKANRGVAEAVQGANVQLQGQFAVDYSKGDSRGAIKRVPALV
jgi:hypothetical protein